jgi:hypothetical protein
MNVQEILPHGAHLGRSTEALAEGKNRCQFDGWSSFSLISPEMIAATKSVS